MTDRKHRNIALNFETSNDQDRELYEYIEARLAAMPYRFAKSTMVKMMLMELKKIEDSRKKVDLGLDTDGGSG